ncbi:CPBP family intramembrane glutamic endopeptidase [Demequina rhizosphaerae]|uniref:CPBP family intramembrane glutamic endopeptidase n=1 Tax=Demequina rhizosphaerae TaxID=1638985 RepID=UPI00078119B2|nr:CPBP family intramembrane glutamic endopeptidase [Demequina rhizosphaerae]
MDIAAPAPAAAPAPVTLPSRSRMRAEVLIVLGLSLGQTAIYAAIRLIERYVDTAPIASQSTTLNPSRSSIDWIDLIRQVLGIGFALVPVALALYLLSQHGASSRVRLGLVGPARRWWGDVGWGVILAASIGLPGLALYAISRALGQTVRIDTSGLPDMWWSATILLLSAAAAGVLEEFVVVGFVLTRLRDMGRSPWTAIVLAALLRGAYHLYQGWPMALGNVVMGLVFGWVYVRRGRLAPLVLAHWTLDAVAFIGPEVVPHAWLEALGVA